MPFYLSSNQETFLKYQFHRLLFELYQNVNLHIFTFEILSQNIFFCIKLQKIKRMNCSSNSSRRRGRGSMKSKNEKAQPLQEGPQCKIKSAFLQKKNRSNLSKKEAEIVALLLQHYLQHCTISEVLS